VCMAVEVHPPARDTVDDAPTVLEFEGGCRVYRKS
jgi:hypothetical protein